MSSLRFLLQGVKEKNVPFHKVNIYFQIKLTKALLIFSITDVDQITWRRPGKHRNHLITDSGKFIVSNVSVADEGKLARN